jgi:hypothetical protein
MAVAALDNERWQNTDTVLLDIGERPPFITVASRVSSGFASGSKQPAVKLSSSSRMQQLLSGLARTPSVHRRMGVDHALLRRVLASCFCRPATVTPDSACATATPAIQTSRLCPAMRATVTQCSRAALTTPSSRGNNLEHLLRQRRSSKPAVFPLHLVTSCRRGWPLSPHRVTTTTNSSRVSRRPALPSLWFSPTLVKPLISPSAQFQAVLLLLSLSGDVLSGSPGFYHLSRGA